MATDLRASASLVLAGLVAILVVCADQATKALALEALADGPIVIIEGWLNLRLVFNTGWHPGISRYSIWLGDRI